MSFRFYVLAHTWPRPHINYTSCQLSIFNCYTFYCSSTDSYRLTLYVFGKYKNNRTHTTDTAVHLSLLYYLLPLKDNLILGYKKYFLDDLICIIKRWFSMFRETVSGLTILLFRISTILLNTYTLLLTLRILSKSLYTIFWNLQNSFYYLYIVLLQYYLNKLIVF